MLLALGLNITVGYAGMLDLGYIAFYGFGAYVYAMLASDKFGQHWPTATIFPVVVILTMILGLHRRAALAAARRRLPRDRDALLRAALRHDRQQRQPDLVPRLHRGYDLTGGPNGIADIDPFHFFGRIAQLGHELLLRRARLLPRDARGRLPAERVAHGPRLAVAARGLARGRDDGHAREPAEARRVRVRRRRRRAHRHALRLAEHGRLRRRLRHARC